MFVTGSVLLFAAAGGKIELFVKNVSYEATEDDLKNHFEGAINVKLPLGPDGQSRG